MYTPWQSSHSEFRSRILLALALLAAAVGLSGGEPKVTCSIPDVEVAWSIDLNACLPKPVSSEDREKVVSALPAAGSLLQLGRKEQGKLELIKQVLEVHGRAGVYAIKVIAVPQMWTGLHERSVLLISYPALTVLRTEELQALVAHEIGHEYVWEEYSEAKIRRDRRRVRELELACDVIAIRTLLSMGLSPKWLQTATEKAFWYNREQFGVARNQSDYPSLKERGQLVERGRFLLRN